MYLHLGQNTVVTTGEIVGFFDMDNTTVSKTKRDFLSAAERQAVIPMSPRCESLNAAVAATVVLWELRRQEDRP